MTDKTKSGFGLPDSFGKRVEATRIKVARVRLDEIRAMPDEDLLKLLNGEAEIDGMLPIPTQQVISSELLRRQLERGAKPHWTALPSFWMLVISTSATLIALAVAIFSVPQERVSVLRDLASFVSNNQDSNAAPGRSADSQEKPRQQDSSQPLNKERPQK